MKQFLLLLFSMVLFLGLKANDFNSVENKEALELICNSNSPPNLYISIDMYQNEQFRIFANIHKWRRSSHIGKYFVIVGINNIKYVNPIHKQIKYKIPYGLRN